jgi:hypothetical protein
MRYRKGNMTMELARLLDGNMWLPKNRSRQMTVTECPSSKAPP